MNISNHKLLKFICMTLIRINLNQAIYFLINMIFLACLYRLFKFFLVGINILLSSSFIFKIFILHFKEIVIDVKFEQI